MQHRTLSIHNLNIPPNILVLSRLNIWAQHSQPLTDVRPTLARKGMAQTNKEEGKKSGGSKHANRELLRVA